SFLLDWSKLCRGLPITPLASFDRSVVIEAGRANANNIGLGGGFLHPPVGQAVAISARLGWRALTDMHKEIFRIPADAIQHWKTQAKAELPNAKLSTGKLLTAYVMRTLSPLMPTGMPRRVGIP